MRLSDHLRGRDNNFNLVRLVAALSVLVTHCFVLATGEADIEPLRSTLGNTLGNFAVDLFFLTSGFLVTGSLLAKRSVVEFVWARALRIYPGLWAMLAIAVVGLGIRFSPLPFATYLGSHQTLEHVTKCSTLFNGVSFSLPGVFADNPFANIVNGSLWTMPTEVRMYRNLAILWLALALAGSRRPGLARFLLVGIALYDGIRLYIHLYRDGIVGDVARWEFMFFAGSAILVLADRIHLTGWIFWPLLAGVVAAAFHPPAFLPVYIVSIPYILLYLALVPSGPVRRCNRFSDYSYGIYIYAFPIQQTVVALRPGISIRGLIAISLPATLVAAVLSWHLVESRALRLKPVLVERTRSLLGSLRRGLPAARRKDSAPPSRSTLDPTLP